MEVDLINMTTQSNQSNKQQAKACLFNLVSFAESAIRQTALDEAIGHITKRFPCRQIVITVDGDREEATKELQPSFFNHMQAEHEKIVIRSPLHDLQKVPFLVMPHLVPDLPIYLLWGQDPTLDKTVLPHFQPLASRLIFDTSGTRDWASFSQHMLDKMNSHKFDVVDMQWTLVSSWRDVITSLFNNSSAFHDLHYVTEMHVNCSADPTSGIYLCSWMAAQLEWELVKGDATHAIYEHANGSVVIKLTAKEVPGTEFGAITHVELHSATGTIYNLNHCATTSSIIVKKTLKDHCPMPIAMPFTSVNKSVSYIKELLLISPSNQYGNMLRNLALFSNK